MDMKDIAIENCYKILTSKIHIDCENFTFRFLPRVSAKLYADGYLHHSNGCSSDFEYRIAYDEGIKKIFILTYRNIVKLNTKTLDENIVFYNDIFITPFDHFLTLLEHKQLVATNCEE